MSKKVKPIHFEDFDGKSFERLAFAFLLRSENWIRLEWYGQAGHDEGRDIWGEKEKDGYPEPYSIVYQCKNTRKVNITKTRQSIDLLTQKPKGLPNKYVFIGGGSITPADRINIETHCNNSGIFYT